MPRRIQRRRTKGWRVPDGAVYVGRPTRWGNPFRPGRVYVGTWTTAAGFREVYVCDAAHAVALYRRWLFHRERSTDLIPVLRGHDLACWCPLDAPCHADVLLEIANPGGV